MSSVQAPSDTKIQFKFLQNIEKLHMQYAFQHVKHNINHQPISEVIITVMQVRLGGY